MRTKLNRTCARCRCTIVAYLDGSDKGQRATRDDDGSYQRVPADMSYRDWKAVYIDKSKTFETWQAEFDARSKADENSALRQRGRAIIEDLTAGRLPTAASNAKVAVGALNDKNDPGGKKRNAHAEMFYAVRRNSKKEPWVKRIAQNSGMSEKAISKIFDHVFIKEHDLGRAAHFSSRLLHG